jgi:ribosomal protein S14
MNNTSIKNLNNRKKRWTFQSIEALIMSNKLLNDSQVPSFSKTVFSPASLSKIENICLVTSSTNKVLSKFKQARHSLKKNNSLGLTFGWKKSVW